MDELEPLPDPHAANVSIVIAMNVSSQAFRVRFAATLRCIFIFSVTSPSTDVRRLRHLGFHGHDGILNSDLKINAAAWKTLTRESIQLRCTADDWADPVDKRRFCMSIDDLSVHAKYSVVFIDCIGYPIDASSKMP